MLKIIIPMAGEGTRFLNKGYKNPKPFIDVNGKPMIQVVIDNISLNCPHQFIFIFQKKHNQEHNFQDYFKKNCPGSVTVEIDGLTKGPALTALWAADFIDKDDDVLIANSDQFVDIDFNDFIKKARQLDGCIMTFKSDGNPKWSFVKLDENGLVIQTAEKNPISDIATVGIYYFKKMEDLVDSTKEMIVNDDYVNGEIYICPGYNYLIKQGKKIGHYLLDPKDMFGLGTPEDLNYYLNHFNEDNKSSRE
jgi:dTDP-glucose pyrophosphorylase